MPPSSTTTTDPTPTNLEELPNTRSLLDRLDDLLRRTLSATPNQLRTLQNDFSDLTSECEDHAAQLQRQFPNSQELSSFLGGRQALQMAIQAELDAKNQQEIILTKGLELLEELDALLERAQGAAPHEFTEIGKELNNIVDECAAHADKIRRDSSNPNMQAFQTSYHEIATEIRAHLLPQPTATLVQGAEQNASQATTTPFENHNFPNNRGLRDHDLALQGGEYLPRGAEGSRPSQLDELAVAVCEQGANMPCLIKFDLENQRAQFYDATTGAPFERGIRATSKTHYPVCHQGENRSQTTRASLERKWSEGHVVQKAYGALGGGYPFFIPGEDFITKVMEYADSLKMGDLYGMTHLSELEGNTPMWEEDGQPVYRKEKFSSSLREDPPPLFRPRPTADGLDICPHDLTPAQRRELIEGWKERREELIRDYFGKIIREGGVVYCYNKSAQIIMLGLLEASERTGQDLSRVTVIPIDCLDPFTLPGAPVPQFRACVEQMLDRITFREE